MMRERSRTRRPFTTLRAVEKALGHGVDLGDARAGDGVDARLHLGQRPERLGQQRLREGAHGLVQLRPRHHAREEPQGVRLGRRVAAALHDDLLGAGGPDHAHEARGGGHAEGDAEVDLGDPELRLGRRDAEVAGEGEPPAAADRVAVDHGDGRLLQVLQQGLGPLEQPAELRLAPGEGLAALLRRHARLQAGIGARRRRRGARRSRRPRAWSRRRAARRRRRPAR